MEDKRIRQHYHTGPNDGGRITAFGGFGSDTGSAGAGSTPTSVTAADVPIVDAGALYTSTNVEDALQEAAGFAGIAEILDIPTAETDAALVLAPDGAGGVEFRAEAGGGGLAASYLGYNTVGGSNAAIGSLGATGYGKKITLSGTSTILSISAHIAMASLAGTVPWAAVYADSGGNPDGPPLAMSYHGAIASGGLVWTTPTTGGWLALPIGELFAAGDYWIVFGLTYQATSWRIYYDGSGSDKEITFTDGGYVEGITYRASLASAGNKYSIRALVLA